MKEKIKISGISYDSIFKLLFFGSFPVIMIFCILVTVGVLIKGIPENPDPNALYGWQAVFAALVLGAIWPLMFSLIFSGIAKLGLFATFKFKKSLMLEIERLPTMVDSTDDEKK